MVRFMWTRVEVVLPVAVSVVTLRIAEARRRSLGRIKLYACHWSVQLFYQECRAGGKPLTMSSGSSGRRVALPEPSLRSMCCLIRRMLS